MSDVSEIRPAYPIVPVKRRDHESPNQEKPPRNLKKQPPASGGDDEDSQPPIIDEYV